jgi:hypothetical protein
MQTANGAYQGLANAGATLVRVLTTMMQVAVKVLRFKISQEELDVRILTSLCALCIIKGRLPEIPTRS